MELKDGERVGFESIVGDWSYFNQKLVFFGDILVLEVNEGFFFFSRRSFTEYRSLRVSRRVQVRVFVVGYSFLFERLFFFSLEFWFCGCFRVVFVFCYFLFRLDSFLKGVDENVRNIIQLVGQVLFIFILFVGGVVFFMEDWDSYLYILFYDVVWLVFGWWKQF